MDLADVDPSVANKVGVIDADEIDAEAELYEAAAQGDPAAVAELQRRGDEALNAALIIAAENAWESPAAELPKYLSAMRCLCGLGDLDTDDALACIASHDLSDAGPAVLDELIALGGGHCDLDSALAMAAAYSQPAMVDLLISRGATDLDEALRVAVAAEADRQNIVYLIRLGARVQPGA